MIREVVVAAFVAAGLVFFTAGTVGLLRFPDLRSRLHALSKADNVGLGFILIGLMVWADSPAVVAKLLLIWGLALFAAATNSALLASRQLSAPRDD
jgi:multicomponent Na+:H+ antiporter subunit G